MFFNHLRRTFFLKNLKFLQGKKVFLFDLSRFSMIEYPKGKLIADRREGKTKTAFEIVLLSEKSMNEHFWYRSRCG